jgi:Holliday junction resolvasome RuvABC endonuclease subunit
MGLDLGTVKSGIAEALGDRIVRTWIVSTKRGDGPSWRYMASIIKDNIKQVKPHYVAIEATYLGKNARTFEVLVSLRGAVVSYCDDLGIKSYIGSTGEIDSACGIVTGVRRERRKRETTAFAKALGWNVPQDIADAICVLYWGMYEKRKDDMLEGIFWEWQTGEDDNGKSGSSS